MAGDLDFSDMLGTRPSWQEPDIILAYLVSSLVNMGGAPLGVTLMVQGTVITGTLMSEREYLGTLSHMLQTQVREALALLPEADRQQAENAFDLRAFEEDSYPDQDDEEADSSDETDSPMLLSADLTYLHLRNPMVISPQPTIGFDSGALPVMRIRLSQIDGWMMGASVPDEIDDFIAVNGNRDIRH